MRSPDVTWHTSALERAERFGLLGYPGATVWLTGLPASGKSVLAVELERRLVCAGRPAYVLDGDNLRHGLTGDLGFDRTDRQENLRRVGHVAALLADAGVVAVASLVSPYTEDRAAVREIHAIKGLTFLEVFVDTPVDECARRDPKGLYARARAGQISGFTGVDAPVRAADRAGGRGPHGRAAARSRGRRRAQPAAVTMPPASVACVAGSIRMKLPV